jgi:hypothetical protein
LRIGGRREQRDREESREVSAHGGERYVVLKERSD